MTHGKYTASAIPVALALLLPWLAAAPVTVAQEQDGINREASVATLVRGALGYDAMSLAALDVSSDARYARD